jgi:hypothetical protein
LIIQFVEEIEKVLRYSNGKLKLFMFGINEFVCSFVAHETKAMKSVDYV